jgi:hypothetical protein
MQHTDSSKSVASSIFTHHALLLQTVKELVKCSKLQLHYLILRNLSIRFQCSNTLGKKTKKKNLRSQQRSKKRSKKLKGLKLKLLLRHNQSQSRKLFL